MIAAIDKELPTRLYPVPEKVDGSILEEMAVKWHSNASDVLNRLREIDRTRQIGYAAAQGAYMVAVELLQPLTPEDKARKLKLEAQASSGRNHPHPRDMQWLGRARQRWFITPLNAKERDRLEKLELDEEKGLIIDSQPDMCELANLRTREDV